ncbi:uncharacterized protein LOC129314459 isoform X2 [Prosopis cineraria]|uniref:uncharacterized protein LOC129314459 isoform X2 n=1 Tax=Prosopis cineraria TaxID=364024 RepID=UPI00240EB3CE|nr:uncharacterized protein LOC129314459 isoform X2 [Prosopis cineraria]
MRVAHRGPQGSRTVIKIINVVRKKKEKNTLSFQIMEKLLQHDPVSVMPVNKDGRKIETPLMIAVKNGVIEMVKKILELYPSTANIGEVNDEGKNIVHLAAEKKQTDVYNYLGKQKILTGSLFQQVDNDGNSALHLAASYGCDRNSDFPGEVLLMQWERKCFAHLLSD